MGAREFGYVGRFWVYDTISGNENASVFTHLLAFDPTPSNLVSESNFETRFWLNVFFLFRTWSRTNWWLTVHWRFKSICRYVDCTHTVEQTGSIFILHTLGNCSDRRESTCCMHRKRDRFFGITVLICDPDTISGSLIILHLDRWTRRSPVHWSKCARSWIWAARFAFYSK